MPTAIGKLQGVLMKKLKNVNLLNMLGHMSWSSPSTINLNLIRSRLEIANGKDITVKHGLILFISL